LVFFGAEDRLVQHSSNNPHIRATSTAAIPNLKSFELFPTMELDAGDDKTADVIIDLMDMELGESSGKQDASARSKFNVFLQKIEHGRSFDSLKKKDVTTELVGKFCSFLLHDTVSWQTSMNYLSSIKRQLETTTRTDLFKREAEWYKRCRRNLHQQFVLQAIKSGKRLKDQAAMMTLEDLEEMSKALFLQNRTVALMDRTLLNN
jgi:hypothetical protein